MAGSLASELSVKRAMEHEGTVHVGRYGLVRANRSYGGLVPKAHRDALGLLDAGETEVYVNYELGVVMHKIPDEVADGDD